MKAVLIVFTIATSALALKKINLFRSQSKDRLFEEDRASSRVQWDLENYENEQYYGLILVGTPAKEFRVLIDTSKSNLWLPSSSCDQSQPACANHRQYDSSKSTTYAVDGRQYFIEYGSGQDAVIGFFSADRVCEFSPGIASVCIKELDFLEVTKFEGQAFDKTKYDGILGAGLRERSFNNLPTFLDSLHDQGDIKNKQFGVWLHDDPYDPNGIGGSVVFGEDDDRLYKKPMTHVKIAEPGRWEITADWIYFESEFDPDDPDPEPSCGFGKQSVRVLINPAQKLFSVPYKQADIINNYLDAKYVLGNRYQVDCERIAKKEDLVFIFNGVKFIIKAKDYTYESNEGGWRVCYSAIQPLMEEWQTDWIVGANFLQQFYVSYNADKGSVGIAKKVPLVG